MNPVEHNSSSQAAGSIRLLSAMFLVGAFSMLAQVVFFREMMVVFFGNELVVGVILAGWFIGISLGAFAARALPARLNSQAGVEAFIPAVIFVMAVLLPLQVYWVKIIRQILSHTIGMKREICIRKLSLTS